MRNTVLATLAATLQAYRNCCESGNTVWEAKHLEKIEQIIDNLPSGSGIDCGTKLDEDVCTPGKIVFIVSYHHMNDGGMYDGWTEHKIIATPSFDGFDLKITGRDRNQIKDYLAEVYYHALSEQYESIEQSSLEKTV